MMNIVKKSALTSFLLIISQLSHAAASLSREANPGFYHFKLGSYQVTALSDGLAKLLVEQLLVNDSWANIQKSLSANHSDIPTTTYINAYLVNIGKKLVLFDTGSGNFMGDNLGKLSQSLENPDISQSR